MAKKNAREPTPSMAATSQSGTTTDGSTPPPVTTPSATSTIAIPKTGSASVDVIVQNLYKHYITETPQRTKLLDVFLVFLVVVGAIQFLYCVLAGNFPFNAFLSGFSATVGQFVLTISLRTQTSEAAKSEFPSVSPERAFADFVVCSLILHFFCINFIN